MNLSYEPSELETPEQSEIVLQPGFYASVIIVNQMTGKTVKGAQLEDGGDNYRISNAAGNATLSKAKSEETFLDLIRKGIEVTVTI